MNNLTAIFLINWAFCIHSNHSLKISSNSIALRKAMLTKILGYLFYYFAQFHSLKIIEIDLFEQLISVTIKSLLKIRKNSTNSIVLRIFFFKKEKRDKNYNKTSCLIDLTDLNIEKTAILHYFEMVLLSSMLVFTLKKKVWNTIISCYVHIVGCCNMIIIIAYDCEWT